MILHISLRLFLSFSCQESVWGGVNQCAMQGHRLGSGLQMQVFEFQREHTTFQRLLSPVVRPKNLLHIFLESSDMKQRHQQLFCREQPGRPVSMGQTRGGSITETTSTALQSPREGPWKTTAESVSRLCWQEGETQLQFQKGREGICTEVTEYVPLSYQMSRKQLSPTTLPPK